MDITTLALAKAYAKHLFESGGSKGSSVSIDSIVAIEGGNRITFSYIDNGAAKTETLDVMDGKQGASIIKAEIDANKQLILTLSNNTTVNAGTVPFINGDDGVSITNVQIDESNHLIVTLSNSKTIDAGLIETIAGKNGNNGSDGEDGISPEISVTETDTGATITIKDVNGEKSVTLKNGSDGKTGNAGKDGNDGTSITAITLTKDENGNIVGGTAILSDNTEIDITIT